MFRKYTLVLVAVLAAVACRDKGGVVHAEFVGVALSRQYSNDLLQDQQEGEPINSLRYYICDGGVVSFRSPDLAAGAADEQTIQVDKSYVTSTSKIYALANGELAADVDRLVVVGAAESVLTSLSTSQSGSNGQVQMLAFGAAEALSAYQNGGVIPLKLKRNMARFDLSIQKNVPIEVLAVKVDGLQTAGSVFEQGRVTSDNTASYVSDFAAPQTKSIEGLFYAHPSIEGSAAAVVTVDAKYNGNLVTLRTKVDRIDRNTIHVIGVVSSMGVLSLDMSISGMEMGDSDTVGKNEMSLRIDKDKCQLPSGASVSDDGLRLHMPYWGASATIVLDAPEGLIFKGANDQTDNFSITPTADAPQGLSYRITTGANNRTNGDKKTILLSFSHPDDKYNNEMRLAVVIENFAAFPAVSLADLDWMHSNVRGQNPTLYQQFFNDQDVRTMLDKPALWSEFAGRSYQWGPRPGKNGVQISFYPLGGEFAYGHGELPTLNGAIIGTPTQWSGPTVPCPAGWRLPTYAEFASIWPPNNTTVPIDAAPTQYTINGKQYSAVIETFGGSYHSNITNSGIITGSSQKARSLLISDGQTRLIFPICGFRKPNGTFKPDATTQYNNYGLGVGAEAFYWCGDKGPTGQYVAVGISNQVIQNHQNNREHNAWYSVRCVRKTK